jgi:hypothetical protein
MLAEQNFWFSSHDEVKVRNVSDGEDNPPVKSCIHALIIMPNSTYTPHVAGEGYNEKFTRCKYARCLCSEVPLCNQQKRQSLQKIVIQANPRPAKGHTIFVLFSCFPSKIQ